MAIVLVEQYYDFAAELADQYLVMERGEIVARGTRQRHGGRRRAAADVDLSEPAARRAGCSARGVDAAADGCARSKLQRYFFAAPLPSGVLRRERGRGGKCAPRA